jgi:hypothetical protein
MKKILFSLPVHERPDILRGQIENINYFCPGSVICIHVSADATASKDEFRRYCDFENVLINPQSHQTVWSHGIMHTHIANFLWALEAGVDFDTVMLISSNELLVKHGLADYVSQYELGSQTEVYDPATDWHVFRSDYLDAAGMRGFLSALGLPTFFGGQAEGQFASKGIFLQIAKLFVENFPMAPCGFPVEEIILPTVAARYSVTGVDVTLPITLCNYCNNLEINADVIEQVRRGAGSLVARRVPRNLRSPHIGTSVLKGVFSVKRVPRADCDLRRYIFSLMT